MARKRKEESTFDAYTEAKRRNDEERQAQAAVPRELIPDTVEYAEAKRKRDDDHMNELQRSFAENAAKAVAVPGQSTENVLVVKTSERAAQQEQARIDEGKEAAANQQPEPPPEPPPEEGTVPEWVNPKHPFVPNAFGSAPHSATMPAGLMGEKVIYVTDDLIEDGTPLIEGAPEGVAEPSHALNGYTNTLLTDIDPNWQHHPADADADKSQPKLNRHSVEGAGVEQMKLQRDVVFVPKDEAQGSGGPGGY
jgi:hypothetical protein